MTTEVEQQRVFSLNEVAFSAEGPVTVQLAPLRKLPVEERNKIAWRLLEQALEHQKSLRIVE